jgi:TonB family protein
MRKAVLLLLATLMPPAEAQQPPADGPAVATACSGFPPFDGTRTARRGSVVLSVHVNASGFLQNARVAQSSGDADVDAAALACASEWNILPRDRRDNPVPDFDWSVRAEWNASGLGFLTIDREGNFLSNAECANAYDRFLDRLRGESRFGVTTIKFRISTDGSVVDPVMATSSGDPDIDALSLQCVRVNRYYPASRNGAPIEVDWQMTQTWNIH